MGAFNVSNVVSQVVKDIGPIEDVLSATVCEGIKTLLEGRHLYQNVKFGEAKCRDELKKYLSNPETSSRIEEEIKKFKYSPLDFGFQIESANNCHIRHKAYPPQTVDTDCEFCGCVTSHNPDCYYMIGGEKTDNGYDETIALCMQCQKCKRGNLTVMIRRKGFNLQLVGRNQIDHYKPQFNLAYLPKCTMILDLFAQAVMAERTGSHLAAICLLRVALEQFMRAAISKDFEKIDGSKLYEKFAKHLHKDFPRSCVCSLSDVYGRLSERMHNPSLISNDDFAQEFQKVEKYMQFLNLMPLERIGENLD